MRKKNGKRDHEEALSKDKKQKEKSKEDKVHKWEKKNEAPIEDFVIEKIVDHDINTSRWHRYAKVTKALYHVRWYG